MKIVNIDATETVSEKVWGFQHFILEVLSSLNSEIVHNNHHQVISQYHGQTVPKLPLSPIRKFYEDGYENIVNLVHTIPVYLRESRPKSWNEEEDIVDPLGAYSPNRKNDSPYIEMYADSIYSCANNNEEEFKWLFTKVLVHELAHAALDIFNNAHCHQAREKVFYCTEFGKWREESMANAVTLRIIKDFGNERFYNYAKQFMLSQPAEYALGVLMDKFDYWDFRSVMDGKRDGVHAGLQQEWLYYAKGNPSWKGLKLWNKVLTSTPDENNLILVQDPDTEKYGMVDENYTVHIPLEYDSISITSSNIYLVSKNNQYAILDCKNCPIVPFGQYDLIEYDSKSRNFIVSHNGKFGMLDTNAVLWISLEYSRIDKECWDFRWVKKGMEFALVDRNFNPVSPFAIYEDVDEYVDGHAPVKQNGKWGAIDKSGNLIIPCEYDKIWLYNGGAARIFKEDAETRINLKTISKNDGKFY